MSAAGGGAAREIEVNIRDTHDLSVTLSEWFSAGDRISKKVTRNYVRLFVFQRCFSFPSAADMASAPWGWKRAITAAAAASPAPPVSSQVVFEASGLFGAAFTGDVADFVATVGAFFVGFDRRAKRQGVCAGSGHV